MTWSLKWKLVLLVHLALIQLSTCVLEVQEQRCWEPCYRVEDCPEFEHFRPAFNDFFSAGAEAMRLAAMYTVNGTALMFDSTLSPYHDWHLGMDSEESGAKIFKYQKDLASIIAIMLGSDKNYNPLYVVQFDDAQGWGCDNWRCMDHCEAVRAIDYLECVKTDATGYRDNRIEPACRMANDFMKREDDVTCAPFIDNEMAIAFVNSDFDHNVRRVAHDHGFHNENHYSACQSHFRTRLAIGTHAVDQHEMRDWQSPDAHYSYIRDNDYTFEAASNLRDCMMSYCCDIDYRADMPLPKDDTCFKATDDYSEEISQYTFTYHPWGSALA